MERSITFAVYTQAFWKAYAVQMRPYLLFVSGAAGMLGVAVTTHDGTPIWKPVLAFIPFFLGYGFGQSFTDCFQTDTDKISAPYRPLSQGIITIRSVMTTGIVGLLMCAFVLLLLNPLNVWLCVMSVFGLATYSYVKRNLWFAGPFYNAWIVALLPLMGMLSAGGKVTMPLLQYAAITFFSYANFVLIGYLKDIEADRATGYKTFPVVFGWKRTVFAGDILAFITVFLFWQSEIEGTASWICGLAASVVIVTGLTRAHMTASQNEIGALTPILSTVRSFVLFHLALILTWQPDWFLAAALFYFLFEIALYLRPARYQI
ncbi:MAG TPA: UbiA family prenyltransferase [Chryseosolibacter sp.]|nr:UbiA family prenyltransferase [Chryseosolibacter sp.]